MTNFFDVLIDYLLCHSSVRKYDIDNSRNINKLQLAFYNEVKDL